MSKHIKNLSSRNDIAGDKILSPHKWREESSCKVEKNKSTSVKENGGSRSDCKSSHKIDSHGKKHHQKESLSKESKTSHHHKKSSKAPKKYESDNSTKNIFVESVLYTPTRKDFLKHISYDPHLELVEGYNPNQPDLFPKSFKNDSNTYEPDQFYSSKSTKRDCGTYEPSVKRKLEVQTETVSESKPKKLKSVQSPEKMDKHKKHSVQGSKSETEPSFSQKKENSDNSLNNCSKEKSANKSNSSKSDKKSKKSHKKAKLKINSTVEFTSSEANFEDCLGLNDIVIKKKKSSKPVQNATKTHNKTQSKVATVNSKQSSSHSIHPATPSKSSSVQKEKSQIIVPKSEKVTAKIEDVNIMSTLPQTLPNYRPLPRVDLHSKKKEVLSNEDAYVFMSSKREKTAVYSGKRSYYTEVPSLFEICTRNVIDNIDYVDYTGGVPFQVLKSVLEKCNPQQLLHIENYNPYLLEDTDELWELHCKRECKLHKLEENETYRELYLRAQDERERKLKSITAHISSSMSKYNPARQVKLAYVDSFVKPPRDVARKQAKNGITSTPESQPVKATESQPFKASLPSKASPKTVTSVVKPASSAPHASNHVVKTKPKVAPLMAKTLKSMKLCFRR